jgi:hypothetical protein
MQESPFFLVGNEACASCSYWTGLPLLRDKAAPGAIIFFGILIFHCLCECFNTGSGHVVQVLPLCHLSSEVAKPLDTLHCSHASSGNKHPC